MNGLSLSKRFFEECRPLLEKRIPQVMACSAAGLAGEGSECLGLDDEISRDHDWGAGFCLWIPQHVFLSEKEHIDAAFASLPSSFMGYPARLDPSASHGRTGPLSLERFLHRFLGSSGLPQTWREWQAIPEYHLCSCTNGEIFMDASGTFSALREELLRHYPLDVLKKKLAARCMIMAQAGQYNLPRSLHRENYPAAMLAAARFAEATLSVTFLLNRRYMPFYKWAGLAVSRLPLLGEETAALINQLACTAWNVAEQGLPALDAIERHCTLIAGELRRQGFTSVPGTWLWALGPDIQRQVEDKELQALNVMED